MIKATPGIFCVIDRIGRTVSETTTDNFILSSKDENCYTEKWVSGPCLLEAVQLESSRNRPSILHDEDMSLVAASIGNIYNKKELGEKFEIQNAISYNDNELLVELYKKKGLDFVKYPNGLFNAVIIDKNKNRVLVANDRYGFYPLFYTLNNGKLAFASEMKSLLTHAGLIPRIDEAAVAEFFTFSYLLGDKTFFRGIKLMMPASELIYDRDKDQIEARQYWDFYIPEEKPLGLRDLLEGFKNLMKKAVDRRVQDKKEIGVFLSGGLDSRILAAFASRTNTRVTTFTFGVKNCPDQEIAQQIAEKLGVENVFYEIPSDFIAKYGEEIVYLGDGLIRIRDCHFIALLEDVVKKVDTVLLGTFGGELFGSKITRELSHLKGKAEVINYLFKLKTTVIPWENHEVFTDASYEKTKGAVRKNFEETFAKIGFVSAADIADYWEYRNRQRRYIFQSFQYMNWYIETRHPFLDNDLVDFFAFRLSFYDRLDERFLQKALNYCFPSLSKIPWVHIGVAPDSPPLKALLGKVTLFAKNKIRMTVENLSKGRVVLAPCDYRGYDKWLREDSKAYALEILSDPRTLRRGYFKPSYIQRILKEHMSYRENHEELICDIINFELLNRIFIDAYQTQSL